MRSAGADVVRGMAAGGAATLVMSGVMLVSKSLGSMGTLPPRKITDATLDALKVRRSRKQSRRLATVAHFAYGVGCGALFAAFEPRVRPPLAPAASGALFGIAVWALSYVGWVPALGIMPPPRRDRPGRQPALVLAHVAYGGVLGALTGSRQTR